MDVLASYDCRCIGPSLALSQPASMNDILIVARKSCGKKPLPPTFATIETEATRSTQGWCFYILLFGGGRRPDISVKSLIPVVIVVA